ncbi:hypothetical protein [Haloglomus salinum]|jgi:hypothetical protein|uniref:hypothetical protein n=1 Tax=Haloglomus salinum TaxID=2962673 RepID=UPI0020C9B87F|nr:hypothetical protein [Haloglomus salinum]
MTATLKLRGTGGLVVLGIIGIVVGAFIYSSPEMVQPWIDAVLERPLVSAGFGILLVVLVLFGDGAPGDDGTA